MKKYLTILILLTYLFSFSQDISKIKKSGLYLYGVGKNKDYRMADKEALDDLISQISVQVESDFINIVEEIDGNIKEYTNSVVKTYSNTTLHNALRQEYMEGDKHIILRYINKQDLNDVFKSRRIKVLDYARTGEMAESECRISDALKNYYWALVLLRSHPENSRIRYQFKGQDSISLLIGLNDRLNRLFSLIDINVDKVKVNMDSEEKTILLKITYRGQPVENYDYRYQHGNEESILMSANDGIGRVDLFGEVSKHLDNLRIKTEYEYKNKIYDPEVRSVMDNIYTPYFAKSVYNLELPDEEVRNEVDFSEENKIGKTESLNKHKEFAKSKYYREVVEMVIIAIEQKTPGAVTEYFTNEGFNILTDLMKNGKVQVVGIPDTLKIIKTGEEVLVRYVPMSFNFENNKRIFIENVVFTFNTDNKINSLSFSISDHAINDITCKSDKYATVEEKYQLIRFIEAYKTAYCLKRIEYIESIFADNALIIVGNVLKEDKNKNLEGMYNGFDSQKIKYVKHTKESYIRSLKNVFARNEFVNIHFEENKVIKRNIADDKIFGIQIAQYYYSTTYSDFGYLFLAVDLANEAQPKIYVRTWQPEKNEDGSVFGLTDFKFD